MKSSATIRFILDGKIIEIPQCDPTRSVLEYLREDLQRCGTKEGCAEGDCGACTVVLGEVGAGRLQLRSINACLLLLPMLQGKLLITVESLAAGQFGLHPVQQAMVDCHGSQCGFCTPGMIMASKVLLDRNANPTEMEIKEALAGNLCRCGSYKNIISAFKNAAEEMADSGGDQ